MKHAFGIPVARDSRMGDIRQRGMRACLFYDAGSEVDKYVMLQICRSTHNTAHQLQRVFVRPWNDPCAYPQPHFLKQYERYYTSGIEHVIQFFFTWGYV